MTQITTLTFFRFSTFADKFWALKMMQGAHAPLKKVQGLQFYKLLGSGKGNGFNPLPDWSVYGLLQVWDNVELAQRFFEESSLMKAYQSRCVETWRLYLQSITAKGEWAGTNPFTSVEINSDHDYVAVITRATIKWSKMYSFWKYVPVSQQPLSGAEGLMYTKGIGEAPFVQMATFSLWESEEKMFSFAYRSPEHKEAIRRTHALQWYKEELFARFKPFLSVGTWGGENPIPPLQPHG